MGYFRNGCSKLVFRVTTLPLLSTTLSRKRAVRYRRVRSEFKVVRDDDDDDDDDDGEICINNITFIYQRVHASARIAPTDFARVGEGDVAGDRRGRDGAGL